MNGSVNFLRSFDADTQSLFTTIQYFGPDWDLVAYSDHDNKIKRDYSPIENLISQADFWPIFG
jgi:hypothetical protein